MGWSKSPRKRLVLNPRFYFFDTRVTNALTYTLTSELNTTIRGRRFEQFIITQIQAIISYKRLDYQLYYWRTNNGAEVDLLICQGPRNRNHICHRNKVIPNHCTCKRKTNWIKKFSECPSGCTSVCCWYSPKKSYH